MPKKYKYTYGPEKLCEILKFTTSDDHPVLSTMIQQQFLLSGDLKEEKITNKTFIEELNRASLLVENQVLQSSEEIFKLKQEAIIKKLKNIFGEKSTSTILKKNFFTQDIIKLGYHIVNALLMKKGLIALSPQKSKHNLFRKDKDIYISVEQGQFSTMDGKKLILQPIELLYKLTNKGFQLLFLGTDDEDFHDLATLPSASFKMKI